MAIYKRGDIYWYEFVFNGERVRESTKQGNAGVARTMENVHKTRLAMGEVGIREKKSTASLEKFIVNEFQPWAQAKYAQTSPKTWKAWYCNNLKAILANKEFAAKPIDEITVEDITYFGSARHGLGLQVSTVNSTLRILRRVLKTAKAWKVIKECPEIELLTGETNRERVITPLEQAKYLAAAPELLCEVATILFDTGFRPDECYRLMWENMNWDGGKHGTILNGFGKTKSARRVLPMTPVVRTILETRWDRAGRPTEGFVFPAPTRSGHIEPSSLRYQHFATFVAIAKWAKEHNEQPVKPFVLYSIRHTFLTRLGASGCDVWTLARVAGHASIAMSNKYVHPDHTSVLNAMEKLNTPHNIPTRTKMGNMPKRLKESN